MSRESNSVSGILIQYIPLADHHDPNIDEFTYGEWLTRGNKLKQRLGKGSYVFFHTSIGKRRYITAYFVVDRVLDTLEAKEIEAITSKYKNPHLDKERDPRDGDIIVFGDPILSKKLQRPLPFTKSIAKKLGFDPHKPIVFKHKRSENAIISSATRQQRKLTDDDVKMLLSRIKAYEESCLPANTTLSTDEVLEILERDLENHIVQNPSVLGDGYNLIGRQVNVGEGYLDLLFEDPEGKITVVEIKLNEVGQRAVNQLKRYMRHVTRDFKTEVRGILLCKDLMPSFALQLENIDDITIYHYGWKLEVHPRNTQLRKEE